MVVLILQKKKSLLKIFHNSCPHWNYLRHTLLGFCWYVSRSVASLTVTRSWWFSLCFLSIVNIANQLNNFFHWLKWVNRILKLRWDNLRFTWDLHLPCYHSCHFTLKNTWAAVIQGEGGRNMEMKTYLKTCARWPYLTWNGEWVHGYWRGGTAVLPGCFL